MLPQVEMKPDMLTVEIVYTSMPSLIGEAKRMYKNSGKTHERPLLWGAPGSLYTGKTRSYLIKKGIDYQEIFSAQPRFKEAISRS